MSDYVTPKIEAKIGVWAIAVALVSIAVGYGTMFADLRHLSDLARNRDTKIQEIEKTLTQQAASNARVEEQLKAQNEKLTAVLAAVRQLNGSK